MHITIEGFEDDAITEMEQLRYSKRAEKLQKILTRLGDLDTPFEVLEKMERPYKSHVFEHQETMADYLLGVTAYLHGEKDAYKVYNQLIEFIEGNFDEEFFETVSLEVRGYKLEKFDKRGAYLFCLGFLHANCFVINDSKIVFSY